MSAGDKKSGGLLLEIATIIEQVKKMTATEEDKRRWDLTTKVQKALVFFVTSSSTTNVAFSLEAVLLLLLLLSSSLSLSFEPSLFLFLSSRR